ncbi:hypothetical protein ACTXT7_005737 [Hymenolepis weldensis]
MEEDFAPQNRPHHCSISPGTSSPIGLSPNIFVEDDRFIESFGDHSRQLDDFSLNLSEIKAPKYIGEVVEVTSLTESNAVELILTAEGRRGLSQWLVVYIRDTTTALTFPPHGCNSLSRCGLTFCMEWLEKCGITQLIVVVPDGDVSNQICRNLLFIGFSILPKDVVTDRLPSWLMGLTSAADHSVSLMIVFFKGLTGSSSCHGVAIKENGIAD